MGPAIVGLLALGGASILGTAAGGLTLVGSVLAAAIDLGIGFGLNALRPKPPDAPKTKTVFRLDAPVRRKHFGKLRVGGKLVHIGTYNGALNQVIYISEGPISAFNAFYLDDRPVTLTGTHVDEDPFAGSVYIETRLGTAGQSALTDFSTLQPLVWTAQHKASGCAIAWLKTDSVKDQFFSEVYPNRITVLNVEIDGCKVYDPRIDARIFTPNLVLILREYLNDPDGAQIDQAYIDNADFAAAADHADDIIAAKSDPETAEARTVRRYWGQYSYDFDSNPGDNVARLLQATCGRLYLKPNGKIGYYAGRYYTPTVSITDNDIIDYDFEEDFGPLHDANEVVVKYTYVEARHATGTSLPWRDEASISESGQVKSLQLDAFEAQSHNHARRIAALAALRHAARWHGRVTTTLAGMAAWDEWFVNLTIGDLEISNESFELLGIAIDIANMRVTMRVASFPATGFDFDPETEEGDVPALPEDLESGTDTTVYNLEAHCEQRMISGRPSAVLVATWDDADSTSLDPQAQYSRADFGSWLPMPMNDSETRAETTDVIDGELYDVRVRWKRSNGLPGTWDVYENVLAVADATAPGEPEFTAELDPADATKVLLSATASDVDRTATLAFYRTGVEIKRKPASPGETRRYADTPGAGAYVYKARAENVSGVASTYSAAVTVTVP